MVMSVRLQFDLVNLYKIPVCDPPYHMNKSEVHKGEDIEVWQNCELVSVRIC